nr:hypothetical protein CFP56_26114 [Quercus suber]
MDKGHDHDDDASAPPPVPTVVAEHDHIEAALGPTVQYRCTNERLEVHLVTPRKPEQTPRPLPSFGFKLSKSISPRDGRRETLPDLIENLTGFFNPCCNVLVVLVPYASKLPPKEQATLPCRHQPVCGPQSPEKPPPPPNEDSHSYRRHKNPALEFLSFPASLNNISEGLLCPGIDDADTRYKIVDPVDVRPLQHPGFLHSCIGGGGGARGASFMMTLEINTTIAVVADAAAAAQD